MAKVNLEVLMSGYLLLCRKRRKRKQTESKKRHWVKPYVLDRPVHGAYHALIDSLLQNKDDFTEFMKMPPMIFKWLTKKVSPIVSRQNTEFRQSISPAERLAVTLRFLATGRLDMIM